MTDKNTYIIVAVDEKNGIGKAGKMAWNFKKEMQYFKDTTSETVDFDNQNMVVMGRKTWESIDPKYRPLKGRKNIIITHNRDYKAEGATICYSLGEAFKIADNDDKIDTVFIIGGAQIFELALPVVNGIYMTKIEADFECDVLFPEIPGRYEKIPERLGSEEEKGIKYDFQFYKAMPEL